MTRLNWIKEKWNRFKKWVWVVVLGGAIALAAPVALKEPAQPILAERVATVEGMALYDTPSGFLTDGYYHYDGKVWEVMDDKNLPPNSGTWYYEEPKNIKKYTEAQMVGSATVHIFESNGEFKYVIDDGQFEQLKNKEIPDIVYKQENEVSF